MVKSHLADVVAVIHRGDAHGLEVQHGLHLGRAALRGGLGQAGVLCGVALRIFPLGHGPARGQVAVDQVVRRSLVSDQIGLQATRLGAAHQLGQHLGGVAQQGNRHRFFGRRVVRDHGQGFVDVLGLLVHIAGAQTEVDAALLALDVQRTGPGQCGSQGLCAAHATQARRQNPATSPVVVVVLAAGFDKGLERALHDALAADVDP